jgi:FkbM family methyltransferase
MILIDKLNFLLKKKGAELVRFPNSELKKRKATFKHFKINKVFDIGANVGQYALDIRELEYKGEIISFEPIKNVFNILEKNTKKDKFWTAENYALGDFDGETEINVAGNAAASSSILEMLPAHEESAPHSKYVGTEKIKVNQLDTVLSKYCKTGDNIYMKIDAQGYEKSILDGALTSLHKIKVLQIELSLIPLYKDAIDYQGMIEFLKTKGFDLYGLEPGFSDPITGRLLQCDGVFMNKALL